MHIIYPHPIDAGGAIGRFYREFLKRVNHEATGFAYDPSNVEIQNENVVVKSRPRGGIQSLVHHLDIVSGENLIIHTGPLTALDPFSVLAGWWYENTSMLCTVHNAEERAGNQARLTRLLRQCITPGRSVVAVSEYVADTIGHEYGASPRVIHNGVDVDQFRPDAASTQPDRLLYVGRDIGRKNPDFLRLLANKLPDYRIHARIPGYSNDRRGHGTVSNITLLPRLSMEELQREYAAAKCLLCPFQREGFGLVGLEALASGTAVIALDDGAFPEFLDSSVGSLCEGLEPEEWAKEIEQLDVAESDCRARAKEFTWDRTVEQYESIYSML